MLAYLRGPDGAMGETPQFCVPLFWGPLKGARNKKTQTSVLLFRSFTQVSTEVKPFCLPWIHVLVTDIIPP